jgi:putative ABC transport system substrate-binding protein
MTKGLRRRELALAGALALLASSTRAQAPSRIWRVGVLSITSAPRDADARRIVAAFGDALRERGYVEGRNLVFERRFADGVASRLPALAAELVALAPDVIVVNANPVAHAARQATTTIPIVMVLVSDPVRAGLVASLAGSGNNLTGITDIQSELTFKRLELLKAAVPGVTRVASLTSNIGGFDPATLVSMRGAEAAAASRMGLVLTHHAFQAPPELGAALASVASARPQALFLDHRPLNYVLRREIAEFATRERLPCIGSQREQAAAGILMTYGTSTAWQSRMAAGYVDRIFKGAKPSELPIEQPTTFELVVNLKTAKEIGVVMPQSLLVSADEQIE